MTDEEIIRDPTEPEPMKIGESEIPDNEPPYLFRVEMYLMSKYYPEFVEATIFKIRAAAFERAKIVKEDHTIHKDIQSLQHAIETDLLRQVAWSPQRPHKSGARAPVPGIGSQYQRELDNL